MLMCMRMLLFDHAGGFSPSNEEDEDESKAQSGPSSPYPNIDVHKMFLWREKMKSTHSAAVNYGAQTAKAPGRDYGSGDSDDRIIGYARAAAL
jgi:hypothetical protein